MSPSAHVMCCVLAAAAFGLAPAAGAVEVAMSTLGRPDDRMQAMLVRLTPEETGRARRDRRFADELGGTIAKRALVVTGMPGSLTGKMAAAAIFPNLASKYGQDVYMAANTSAPGHNVTLRYMIDVGGLRGVWSATTVSDLMIPGSKLSKAVIGVFNTLISIPSAG